MQLGTDIQFVPGAGTARAPLMRRLQIHTAGNALFCFPRSYEHPAERMAINSLREGQPASLIGRVTEVERHTRPPGKSIVGAVVENEQGAVRLLFFNQPHRVEQLRRGNRLLISGVPKLNGLRMEFVHPKVTVLQDDETLPSGKILPIYPLVEGLRQSDLRRVTAAVTSALADTIEEVLDDRLRATAGSRIEGTLPGMSPPLLGIAEALREIHRPSDASTLEGAKRRLIFQELLVLQLALALRRRRLTTALSAPPLPPTPLIDSRIRNRFPFRLTEDQQRAIAEVGQDMSRQFPMNRLVQGDVGSGKTVVAQYAMLLAVAHRHQAVMMAPTEVLARQHHRTLTQALAHSRVRIGLLCGSLSPSKRREVLRQVAEGEIDVLVGTQALLHGEIRFAKLGLCVIDEQHKFGVSQRKALRRGNADPHYLVLSATPIPRTVTMTLFGDLDVSTLRQKPPGRGATRTYLAEDAWRDRWWQFVARQLDQGRQGFVITPRVARAESVPAPPTAEPPSLLQETDIGSEMNEGSPEDVSSALATFEQLIAGPLAGYRIGLLHGRMSAEEKGNAMEKFVQGETQILVTTTVVEVGIDVPNATVMTILGAERFGIAQLHQLRGRVGRGGLDGHVCLFTDGKASPADNQRLKTFAETQDGFAIAEADFRMRGPGDLLGERQSGMPPLRIADLVRDEAILSVAREIAQELIDIDPELDDPSAAGLKRQVLRRYGEVLDLGDVA